MALTVEQLYTQLVGKQGDPEGIAYWKEQFGETVSPAEAQQFAAVAQNVLQSQGNTDAASSVAQNLDTMFSTNTTTTQQASNVNSGGGVSNTPLTQVSSGSGAYGYQNGAPVLNNNQLKSILGGEMMASQAEDYGLIAGAGTDFKYVPPSVADTVGWNLSSKGQGKILTGAAIHGVTDSVANATRLLDTLDQWNNLPADRKAEIGTIENFFGNELAKQGIETNGAQEAEKAQNYLNSLKTAAGTLNLNPNQSGANLLNAVNQAENRVVVTGRTNSWGQNASGADKEHAAVVYTPDASGRLIAASNVEKFDASDPKTKSAFQNIASGIGNIASIPPITAALASFGAPFVSQALTSALGATLSDTAIQAISRGIINGAATGAITGDAEKAFIGGLLSAGGSYALNSGALGNVMERIGLGDVASQFNIPTTSSITGQGAWLGEGVPSGIDEWDQAILNAGGTLNSSFLNSLNNGTNTTAGTNVLSQEDINDSFWKELLGTGAATTGTKVLTDLATKTTTDILTDQGKRVVDTFTGGGGGTNIDWTKLLTGGANAAINWGLLNQFADQASGVGQNLANSATAAGQAAQVPFTPYTVTTGAGTSTVGPNSAATRASLPYQQIRTQAQQQALDAIGAINPAQASQTMFNQMEALAAPSRERERLAMEERMARQGLFGVGMNMPTVGGEVRTVNPLLESMLSAQATGRAQQALASTQFGTQEAQRLQQLSAGLQNQAAGVDTLEQGMLTSATNLSNIQNQIAQQNAIRQQQASLFGLGLRAPIEQTSLTARMGAASGIGQGLSQGLTQSGILGSLGKYIFG